MESKAEIRRRHRAQRAELSQAESAARAQRLAAVLGEQISADSLVIGYMPMRGEPDVLPLLDEHIRRGGRVFAPVVVDAGTRRLAWAPWTRSVQLRRSTPLPVMEPTGERITTTELLQLAVPTGMCLLVPALAVDTEGRAWVRAEASTTRSSPSILGWWRVRWSSLCSTPKRC